MTRIGVVGAGRVGAVLAAALRAAGHEIVAAAGESTASRTRMETLLPGVPRRKPTAVARSCDLLLLTVPDDMLGNVVTTLVGAGAIRPGQYVVHTSRRHGLAVLEPARRLGAHVVAMHPAMTFTGTDVDLPRLRGCVFGVTAEGDDRAVARDPGRRPRRRRDVRARGQAHALPRGPGPRRQPPGHPRGPGDGAALRLRRRGPGRDAAPAAHRGARQRARRRRRRPDRPDRPRRRQHGARHTWRTSPPTHPPRSRRTSRWPGPPPTARSSTDGCCRSVARRSSPCSTPPRPQRWSSGDRR